MANKLFISGFCAIGLALLSEARADTNIFAVSQLASPVYTLGGTARATAMGDTFAGIADDASALFYNPAGLGWLETPELSAHENSWLVDTSRESVLLGLPLSTGGAMATSFSYMDWGSFDIRDQNGTLEGSYTDRDLEVALGWGEEFWGKGLRGLSLGFSVRGLKERLYDNDDFGVSADLGALWVPDPLFRVGLSYTHLGTAIEGSTQASNLDLAASLYDYHVGRAMTLTLAGATSIQPSGNPSIQLGAEAWISSIIAFRAGYVLSLTNDELGGLSGLTGGLGFKLKNYEVDYSYEPYGDLGVSQWISLTYRQPKSVPSPRPTPLAVPTATPNLTPTPSLRAVTYAADLQQEYELKEANLDIERMADFGLRVTMNSDALKFFTMSFDLRPADRVLLAKLAHILMKNPKNRIDIEGYTDDKGEKDYNKRLSLRRADAVNAELLDDGVRLECIRSVKGFGSENPVASNKTAAGRAKNRRVVLGIHLSPNPPPSGTSDKVPAAPSASPAAGPDSAGTPGTAMAVSPSPMAALSPEPTPIQSSSPSPVSPSKP